ncbi:hypothetical protein KAR91_04145 [Candidatus Pacearchaeota archaeon]|nr:hypothetical protein [Candidatus Pacearchaeota archaeon]
MRTKKTKLIDGCRYWQCPSCKKWKLSSQFFGDKRSSNGLTSRCKICHTRTSLDTCDKINKRRINREYARRARKADPEKFKARSRENSKRAVKENGPAYRAYRFLHNALRRGEIEKPLRCEKCNRKHKLTAHHEDYSKPLEVEWLCYECHGQRHWKD